MPYSGYVLFEVDGMQYKCRGNFEVSFSTVLREGIADETGVLGYLETPVSPSIKGVLINDQGLTLDRIKRISGAVLCCVGTTTFVLHEAKTICAFIASPAVSKFAAKIQGAACEEI